MCDDQLAAEYERLVDKNNNDNLNFADILSERDDEIVKLQRDWRADIKTWKDTVVEALGGPAFNEPYEDCIRLRDITCEITGLKGQNEFKQGIINDYKKEVDIEHQRYLEAIEKRSELKEENTKLKEKLKELEHHNYTLRQDSKGYSAEEVNEYREETEGLLKEVAHLKKENVSIKSVSYNLAEDVRKLVEENEEQVAAIHDLEKEVANLKKEIVDLKSDNGWTKAHQSLINEFMERSESWSEYYSWLEEYYPEEHKAEMKLMEELEIGDKKDEVKKDEVKKEEVTKEVATQTEEDILKTYREEIGKIEKEFEEIEDIVDVLPFLQKLKQRNEDGCKLVKMLVDQLHPMTARVMKLALEVKKQVEGGGVLLSRDKVSEIMGFTPEFFTNLKEPEEEEEDK